MTGTLLTILVVGAIAELAVFVVLGWLIGSMAR